LTIASPIEDATVGGILAPQRRNNQRAFRAAMRHSRLVRVVRVGIPFVVIAAVGVFVAYQWLDPMRALARLPLGNDGLALSGTKIVMRQPRLSGFTKDERPYTMVARSAAKDLTNPDVLELEDIRTTIVAPDGRNVEVTALGGLYNSKTEVLRLVNGVVITSPEYEIKLKDALVNVRAGSVVSENPVEVSMMQGTLSANRVEVRESGAVIRFEGGVTLVLDRESAPRPTAGAAR
jgi:lipopolysaccharide export system protein LptC